MMDSWIFKYQGLLLGNPDTTIQRCTTLNPAALRTCPGEGTPIHVCEETINLTYDSRRDVKDQPLENSDETCFIDGSSFVRVGVRHAEYAIVTTFEAKALPLDFSSIGCINPPN